MNTVELVKQMHDLEILTLKIPSYESLIGKAAYNDPVINSTILRIENLMFSGFLFLWAAIIVISSSYMRNILRRMTSTVCYCP